MTTVGQLLPYTDDQLRATTAAIPDLSVLLSHFDCQSIPVTITFKLTSARKLNSKNANRFNG